MTATDFAQTMFCGSVSGICLYTRCKKVVRLRSVGMTEEVKREPLEAIHPTSPRCLIALWSSLFIPRKRDYISLSP